MIRFERDYTEGAHPKILEKLIETNMEQTGCYGEDVYCLSAAEKIRALCKRDDAAVHFLVGGTQTNMTVIAATLRPHEGVISAVSGNVNGHETGAIEATGHKVLTLPSPDGKITARQVRDAYLAHITDGAFEHIVKPGMVYISHPTENGTLYTRAELQALSETCRECDLPLFVDGARLGYGLAAKETDVTLPDLAALTDVFYIGGTKVGAMFGEAVVIMNERIKKDFRYIIKQRGGMLAKGRMLGIQFDVLFTDDLYFEISRHADKLAEIIADALRERGYSLPYGAETNQIFAVLPDADIAKLSEKYSFSAWERVDETHSMVRFCTSWATKEENARVFAEDIKKL